MALMTWSKLRINGIIKQLHVFKSCRDKLEIYVQLTQVTLKVTSNNKNNMQK